MATISQETTQSPQCVSEHSGQAMGSSVHIIATGDRDTIEPIVTWAAARVDELEQRWSRFLASSEISEINTSPGTPVVVSDDTITLVQRALEARRLSHGRFDPTLLQAMRANGYDRTFVSIVAPVGVPSLASVGLGQITIDHVARTVTAAPGSGFDPGGIGKGLAADLVAEEMISRGAEGALVNVGGDLRCIGRGPANGNWVISVGDEVAGVAHRVVELDQGGVAASTRCRRMWKRHLADRVIDAHHLLDPSTGESANDAANLVVVIAGQCADAEWLATAIAADGSLPDDRSMIGNAAVILTDQHGNSATHGDPSRYLR